MASFLALRTVVGASLGLGAVDLLWLNLVLGPQVLAPATPVLSAPPPPPIPEVVEVRVAAPTAPPPAAPALAVVDTATPAEPPAPALAAVDTAIPAEPPATALAPAERVYFATQSAALGKSAQTTLASIVRRAGAAGTIVLEGHADRRGSEALNFRLSRERALAVQAYLERLGIEGSRIQIGFVGKAAAESSGPLWRDRRVEIQIIGGPS